MFGFVSVLRIIVLTGALAAVSARAAESQPPPAQATLASVRKSLASGDIEDARKGMRDVLAAIEREHGSASLEVAAALSRLAMLDVPVPFQDLDEARGLYERALRIRESRLGRNSLGVAKILEALARVHIADDGPRHARHLAIAHRLLKRALRIRQRRLGAFHPDVAVAFYNLAMRRESGGPPRTGEAARLYEHALAIREKAFGPVSQPVADSLLKSADLAATRMEAMPENPDYPSDKLRWCRQAKTMLAWRDRALAIEETLLGRDAPALIPILWAIAKTPCTEIGRPDNQIALLERVVAIDTKAHGAQSPAVVNDLQELQYRLRAPEHYQEKKAAALREAAIRETHLDPVAGFVAMPWSALAAQFDGQDRLDRIEVIDDHLLAMARTEWDYPSRRPYVIHYREVAAIYEKFGDMVGAERVLRAEIASLDTEEKRVGAGGSLASFLARHGRMDEAAVLYRQVVEAGHRDCVANPDVARQTFYYSRVDEYAALLHSRSDNDQAEAVLKDALTCERSARTPSAASLVGRLDAVGVLYAAEDRYADAEAAFKEALQLEASANEAARATERGGHLISADDRLLAQLDRLGDFYRVRGHSAEAEATYRRALALALPRYDGYGSREPVTAVGLGGPQKPAIVDRLERFAAFLLERGARQEAEDLHRRALTIWSTSLEIDMKGASGILKLGDREVREWYGLPRWRLLVPLYRQMGEDKKADRLARQVAAATARVR